MSHSFSMFKRFFILANQSYGEKFLRGAFLYCATSKIRLKNFECFYDCPTSYFVHRFSQLHCSLWVPLRKNFRDTFVLLTWAILPTEVGLLLFLRLCVVCQENATAAAYSASNQGHWYVWFGMLSSPIGLMAWNLVNLVWTRKELQYNFPIFCCVHFRTKTVGQNGVPQFFSLPYSSGDIPEHSMLKSDLAEVEFL